MTTVKEFMDSYNKYIGKDSKWYDRGKSNVETKNGKYSIWYSYIGQSLMGSPIMQMGSMMDTPNFKRSNEYDYSACIRIDINADDDSQKIWADIAIEVPTNVANYEDQLNKKLLDQDFEIDYMESDSHIISYHKTLYDIKDFEYFPKFMSKLSNSILDYIALVGSYKDES